MIVLDTDHVTLLEHAHSREGQRLRERLEQFLSEEWGTTIITYEEQVRGWLAMVARSRSVAQQIRAYGKLSKNLDGYRQFRVLELDERAGIELQRLNRLHLRLGAMDLKIAAIALAHDATLLSRNLKDFRQVPQLRVEDWTA